ncbi:cupin domain-containing protein [Phaeospirillum tilakii]|uniref:Cupin domain-containing protein n=1 Tax=Phaeospirillum tilakii TaxID=741673 RepID=A0ABW5C9F3_9PROT
MNEADRLAALIARLGMQPHPEGGHYVETWRDPPPPGGGRGSGTAILYLLRAGERSHWHRIDATEIWHFHAGAPLRLDLSEDGHAARSLILGPDPLAGHLPQGIVAPGLWQAAAPLGAWSLVGCTVSPAFSFAGFELPPPDWSPDSCLSPP